MCAGGVRGRTAPRYLGEEPKGGSRVRGPVSRRTGGSGKERVRFGPNLREWKEMEVESGEETGLKCEERGT